MRFENLDIDGLEVEAADSETSSELTLLIVPGIEGPRTWKHQYNYFKSDFRTIVIDPESRNHESYVKALKKTLEKKNLSRCILIGSNLGVFVIDRFKDSERVMSTIYTDAREITPKISRELFKTGSHLLSHPKILGKFLFNDKTDYRTLKDFILDADMMNWEEVKSYVGLNLQGGAANALLIHPEKSSFASENVRNILEPDLSVSKISSGSFCFYEKPEEFNKALYDFLNKLESFQKQAEVREKREANRSLEDFEENRKTRKVRRR